MKKTKLGINYIKVLHFILKYSEPVTAFRKTWFVINSNEFEKRPGISRQIFRATSISLESRKMIIHVHIKNDSNKTKPRKYYSITPLGLMYLAQNESEGEFEGKLNDKKIYAILETFLTNSVTRYTSKIIKKHDLDFSNLSAKLKSLIPPYALHELLRTSLESFEETEGTFSEGGSFVYNIELGSSHYTKISTCTFDILSECVALDESLKSNSRLFLRTASNDPQFHHYMATLLITIIIYNYIKDNFIVESGKLIFIKRENKYKFNVKSKTKIPKYVFDIFLIWNNFIDKNIQDMTHENTELQSKLTEIKN